MNDEIAGVVRDLVLVQAPGWDRASIVRGTWLFEHDLALDSVALIEVVCACEDHFDVEIPAEFLEEAELTFGNLVDSVASSVGSRPSSE